MSSGLGALPLVPYGSTRPATRFSILDLVSLMPVPWPRIASRCMRALVSRPRRVSRIPERTWDQSPLRLPYLKDEPRSTHGYDILNHSRVSREIFGAPTLHACSARCSDKTAWGRSSTWAPNHMSISSWDNTWWWDVLENGPSSLYALYFDVDWQPPEEKLQDTVLLPILGDHLGGSWMPGRSNPGGSREASPSLLRSR